jgi:hypothetical protein
MMTSPDRHQAFGPQPRYLPERLSNGYHGVYDTSLNVYVLRDAGAAFARLVAHRLNAPMTWEPSESQFVADAVRHVLLGETAASNDDLVH